MNSDTPFKLIGVTGIMGSGKSEFVRAAEGAGYPVLQTDSVARQIMTSDPEVKSKLIRAFGSDIYSGSGELNTSLIADLVFAPSGVQAWNTLNRIVHPKVMDRVLEQGEELARSGGKIAFVEVPLLYEAGLEPCFDYVVCIDRSERDAVADAVRRSGLTIEQVQARMARQLSRELKKQDADFVIHNDGDLESFRATALYFIDMMEALPPRSWDEAGSEYVISESPASEQNASDRPDESAQKSSSDQAQ